MPRALPKVSHGCYLWGCGEEAGLVAEGGSVPYAISAKTFAEPRGPLDLVGGWAFTPHVKSLVTLGHGTSPGFRQSTVRSLGFEVTGSATPGVLGFHERPS